MSNAEKLAAINHFYIPKIIIFISKPMLIIILYIKKFLSCKNITMFLKHAGYEEFPTRSNL